MAIGKTHDHVAFEGMTDLSRHVRRVPKPDSCAAANGNDAGPLITIPLGHFVGTSPRNNAGLSTKSNLSQREDNLKRTHDSRRGTINR